MMVFHRNARMAADPHGLAGQCRWSGYYPQAAWTAQLRSRPSQTLSRPSASATHINHRQSRLLLAAAFSCADHVHMVLNLLDREYIEHEFEINYKEATCTCKINYKLAIAHAS